MIYYVNAKTKKNGNGSKENPFKTINDNNGIISKNERTWPHLSQWLLSLIKFSPLGNLIPTTVKKEPINSPKTKKIIKYI